MRRLRVCCTESIEICLNIVDRRLCRKHGAGRRLSSVPGATIIHRHGELGRPAPPAFDLLLRYAISEDGALHAEKYYRTVTEEFASTRPAFRWRHLAALARVTASEYGHPAPGIADATRLLGV